ncbi:MAG: hypothetical protein MK082_10110 [Phycisphaerales bacterium]|nr:hypothetical protein [Phycisphaerales bacterium]
MNGGFGRLQVTALLLTMLVATAALACRYTVRDIGFVRLSRPVVQLALIGPSHDVEEVRAMTGDLPLEVIQFDPEHQATHPAVDLARNADVDSVLLSDDGRMLPVADPISIGRSPLSRELAELAASTFAFVLLLESDDPTANAVAGSEIEQLQGRLEAIEEHLPRPLGHSLDVRTLDGPAQEREAVLFWSLGIDVPVRTPTAVITYGRARRAGAPVEIDAFKRDEAARELIAQLALVGESCECDTSRAWTEEPVGLVPWTRDTHATASGALGFDPESPMVRAEVTRILGRGGEKSTTPGATPDSLEELLLGYGETTLEPLTPDPEPVPAASVGDTAAAPSAPVRVLEGGTDDDWSFDDPSDPPEKDDVSTPVADGTPPDVPDDADTGVPNGLYMIVFLVLASFAIAYFVVRRVEGRS